jgi:flavin reductase (DIM6/NTAB) family NADH-FMN oxidoreductase RutF
MSEKQHWKAGNMLYPLPAVMVSCQLADAPPNIITVAWTGTVCTNPAMLYISVRPERYSYPIIKQSGEFVVNLTTKDLVWAADYCGVTSGANVDKFQKLGLTAQPSQIVHCPGIAQSPVNIECKVTQVLELGSHHMFLANVVKVSVQEDLLDETGKFDLSRAGLVHYSHGEYLAQGELLGSFGYSVRKK